jgi:hypothetical protein
VLAPFKNYSSIWLGGAENIQENFSQGSQPTMMTLTTTTTTTTAVAAV